jgi:NAD-dependent dihydropyrimidine dehydrogenase PreA subunit
MPTVKLDEYICTACQTCINTCPMGVFEAQEDKVAIVAADQCIICRACEATCSVDAITIED